MYHIFTFMCFWSSLDVKGAVISIKHYCNDNDDDDDDDYYYYYYYYYYWTPFQLVNIM